VTTGPTRTGAPAAGSRQLRSPAGHGHDEGRSHGHALTPSGGPGSGSVAAIRALQRSAGNRATHALVDGEALPPVLRERMESRFGADFGAVRVHHDDAASESARAESAKAYTVGRDIVFAAGEWSPDTTSGQWLLAHELAHVVQQSRGGPPAVANRASPLEAGAHAAATAVTAGTGPVSVSGAASPGVSKSDEDDVPSKKLAKPEPGPTSKERLQQLLAQATSRAPVPPSALASSPEIDAAADSWRLDLEFSKPTWVAGSAPLEKKAPVGAVGAITQQPAQTPPTQDADLRAMQRSVVSARGFDDSVGVSHYDTAREQLTADRAALAAIPDVKKQMSRLKALRAERKAEQAKGQGADKARLTQIAADMEPLQKTRRLKESVASLERKLAVSALSDADDPSLPSRGAKTGRGQNTYVVMQVLDPDGKVVASALGRNGGGKDPETGKLLHAEQNAISELEQHLAAQGKSTVPGGRVVIVGDQTVCDEVCVPAVGKFAERLKVDAADGYTFHRKSAGEPDSKARSAKTTAQTETVAKIGKDAQGNPVHEERTDESVRRQKPIWRAPAGGGGSGQGGAPPTGGGPAGSAVPAPTEVEVAPPPASVGKALPALTDSPPGEEAVAAVPKTAATPPPTETAETASPVPVQGPLKGAAQKPAASSPAPPADTGAVESEGTPAKVPQQPGNASAPSPWFGRFGRANTIGGALLDAKIRHEQLVASGVDSTTAWLEAGDRAGVTLAANLRGGTPAHLINALNSFERARQSGQGVDEALVTAVGQVGGAELAQRIAKPSAAGLAVEGVNTAAQLLGAPEAVTLTTSGATELVPQQVIGRTLTSGARSWYAISKALVTGDAKALDNLVTDFKKGGAGPWIQGYAQWVDIGVNVASGDSFTKALDKAAAAGKGSWADKAGGGLGEAFADLGENEKALRGDYTPVVQGWAQLSRIGSEMVRGKSFTEAVEVAGGLGKGGLLEKVGSAIGDKAYDAVEKTTEIVNEDLPKMKAAVTHKVAQLRDEMVSMKNEAVEAASSVKEGAVELKDAVVDTVSDYGARAADTASRYAGVAEGAVADAYAGAKDRLKQVFSW
jgi:Domain of unknown function (DUF4157)